MPCKNLRGLKTCPNIKHAFIGKKITKTAPNSIHARCMMIEVIVSLGLRLIVVMRVEAVSCKIWTPIIPLGRRVIKVVLLLSYAYWKNLESF